MKPSDIKVGKTYRNRGRGTTQRKVRGIGDEHRPMTWYGDPDNKPDEPGVSFINVDTGNPFVLYLSAFAKWAGSEVTDEP